MTLKTEAIYNWKLVGKYVFFWSSPDIVYLPDSRTLAGK